ncbi:MAG: DNA translocase FtsK [Nitrosomonadaceae bacterium]
MNHKEIAKQIVKHFEDHGLEITPNKVNVGPIVTSYFFEVKDYVHMHLVEIAGKTLRMVLKCPNLCVELAYTEGFISVEMPNKERDIVNFEDYQERFTGLSKLEVFFGLNKKGEAVFADLAGFPHLLIAGQTGSGKSVALHAIVASLTAPMASFNTRYYFIDPKRVEFARYKDEDFICNSIDGGKEIIFSSVEARDALKLLCSYLDQRLENFAKAKAKDFDEYCSMKNIDLQRIVVMIDEFADLMHSEYAKEIEESVCRLAALGRAAGIHLVIATQRPSVDVLTGRIKANIPARLSFALPSSVDSRTILGVSGAENLLGNGDCLFLDPISKEPIRLQAPFIKL